MRYSIIVIILICSRIYAQNPVIVDTVNYARNMAYEKNFEEAHRLLSVYNTHNKDVHALHLHAQVLYWMKNFKEAQSSYEKALSFFPNEALVLRDYGKLLFDLNKLQKARKLLTSYLKTDSSHSQTYMMLAYIDLWTGHIAAAKIKASWLELQHPGNKEAADILQQIAYYRAPYIKLQGSVYTDDQPMQRYGFEPEAGVYQSWLFSPYIKASLNRTLKQDLDNFSIISILRGCLGYILLFCDFCIWIFSKIF